TEAEGDYDKAIDLLRKKGQKLSDKRADRAANEGVVLAVVSDDHKKGVIIKLSCETDFVSKNEEFVALGRDVAMQVAAMHPVAVDETGVDPTIIEKEIEIGKEVARNEGKADNLIERIAQGKLKKFFKEKTLLNQQFVKDSSLTVSGFLKSKDKELTVTDFKHVTLG
ncbi:UNVERIFIED_CONTAM: hypothetical protein GTU68_042969, partial [Idotea baltica]|nr:hypothetical protein [Idotea baltica]